MTTELMGPTAKPYAEDWLAKILLPDRTSYRDWYVRTLACTLWPHRTPPRRGATRYRSGR